MNKDEKQVIIEVIFSEQIDGTIVDLGTAIINAMDADERKLARQLHDYGMDVLSKLLQGNHITPEAYVLYWGYLHDVTSPLATLAYYMERLMKA